MARPLPRSLQRLAETLYRSLNTPVALSCYLLTRHREWDQLVTKTVDPQLYLDVPSGIERYRRDAQAVDLLRKCDAVPASFDKKKAALVNFSIAEKQCAETNYLIDYLMIGGDGSPFSDACVEILHRARKIISKIVGPVPLSLKGGFGPGTSFELKGSAYNTLADKVWVTPHVTDSAYPIFRHCYEGSLWERERIGLGLPYVSSARGNRFTTVPKDAKTDRGICIEPLGNLYCQLGVGSHLKGRLADVGLYVNRSSSPACPIQRLATRPRPNGQSVHRKLAEMASREGAWATIDLSNASDTVAKNLVRELFTPTWFTLLSSLRSPKTLVDKTWVHLEKFSSMGNGFTFELETLIFAGLISAATGLEPGVELFVYGDDIIVPARASADSLAVLQTFGFTPNRKKTFTDGLFRESCGGDYFGGYDVRSVFVKTEPASPVEWIAVHNRIREKHPWARHALRAVRDNVPVRWRYSGPSWLGDVVLHASNRDHWAVFRKEDEPHVDYVKGIAATPVKFPLDRWGSELSMVLALLGVSSTGITPRRHGEDVVDGWRCVTVSVS